MNNTSDFSSDEAIITWLRWLAPKNVERKRIVNELLRNAIGDRMSSADVTVCRKGLVLLDESCVPETAEPNGPVYG